MIEELYKYFLKSNGVCTDTRKLVEGQLFFALKGERFNGNKYAKQALESGASLAIIDEEQYLDKAEADKYILVSNTLEALQKLANHHRRQQNIPIIAITGSNGKTTTKELLQAVLQKKFKTLATHGNFNNHIGVPLTLLNIKTAEHEMAIIEMGANHVGEIAELCLIAEPDFGLITNIGKAHLEGFGGIEGVKKGKSELYKYIAKYNGLIFFNGQDDVLKELLPEDTDCYNVSIPEEWKPEHSFPFLQFSINERVVKSQLTGDYNLVNMAVAAGIGKYFNISDINIIAAIEAYTPDNNRSQLFQTTQTIFILDSYNANPSSMHKAIKNMELAGPVNCTLVIGDMMELGIYEKEEHLQLLDKIRVSKWNAVFTVGEVFSNLEQNEFLRFNSVEELKLHLLKYPIDSQYTLLKGSRSIALEKILKK